MAGTSISLANCGCGAQLMPRSMSQCVTTLADICVYYSGTNLSGPGINTGDNFNVVLNKLVTFIGSGGGGSGTVTSVGLSMPAAFTVTNSPVTTTGTLTVTGAGTTSQYIRGDGSLATFPAIPSGTVTSVGATINGTAITISGSPVTSTGTLAFSFIGATSQYVRGDGSLATFPTNISTFTNDSGYITASSANVLTNKSGNISQWTNDSGYATASSATNFTNKTGNISQWTNDSGYLTSATLSYQTVQSNTVSVTQRPRLNFGTQFTVTDNAGNTSSDIAVGTNALANSTLAQMASNTIKGNNTGGTANAADLTVSQVNTMLGTLTASPTLGTLYNKSSFANTADFTLVGAPGFTASAGVINVSGGNQGPSATVGTNNAAFNQVAKITAYGGTTLEKYFITYKFTITITPGATTFGTGIGTYSINTTPSLTNCIAYFNMSTATGTGTISILAGSNNTTVAVSSTALTFSNGDNITITMERFGDQIYVSARNVTTGSSLVSCAYVFDTTSSANVLVPNTSNFSVVNFGGTYSITSINVTSGEFKNSNVMFVGDSKLQGYATAWDGRIAAQVGRFFPGTIVCAGQSDKTQDVLNHLPEVIALAPKQVVLCVGRNDLATGVATGTWQANLSSIVSQLQSAGIIVWVVDAIFELVQTQTTLVSYVRSTFPNNYIGLYDPTNNGASVAPDNVHPNFAGASTCATTIITDGILIDNATYVNGTSGILRLSPTFTNMFYYGAIVQPNPYQPVYNANDIVVNAGAAITSAYGTTAQRNRIVISNAGNTVMEFRCYTGGLPTNASFTWFNPVGGATGVQATAMSLTQDAFLTIGNGTRTFTSSSGDVSVFQGKAYRGGSAGSAGNEGAFVPFANSTGATEIRNYLATGTIKFFTSNGVAGSQQESVDIFANGNVGVGQTTDLTTGKLQVNGTITSLGLKPKSTVISGASATLDTTASTWVFSGSSPTTWSLPTIAAGNTDTIYHIKNRGSATITLQVTGGGTTIYNTSAVTSISITAGQGCIVASDGTFWNIISLA